MIGIYKITNKLNNQCYIGQSVNIENRLYKHKLIPFNVNYAEYNNQIHTAIRNFGIENFNFEIIEECEKEKLNEREVYWISFYDSYKNGYNASVGGEQIGKPQIGENNPRSYLKEKDIVYIRECYNNKIPFRKVFEEYKEKATKRCIQKVWYFETWKHILPEYNTEENKLFHKTKSKANPYEICSKNKRAFSEEEIIAMRKRYQNGESIQSIWENGYKTSAKSSIYNAIKRINYKDID